MLVVYDSLQGHAKAIALSLSQELGVKMASIEEAKKDFKKTNIIFVSYFMFGKLHEIKKVRKMFQVKIIIGVGMTNPNEEAAINKLINKNKLIEPFYYFKGGLDSTNFTGLKKKLIDAMKDDPKMENGPFLIDSDVIKKIADSIRKK